MATGVPVASVDLQHDVAEAVRRAGDLLLQATRAVQTDAGLRDAIVDGVAEQTQLVRRLMLLLEQRARCFVFMLGLLGVLLSGPPMLVSRLAFRLSLALLRATTWRAQDG